MAIDALVGECARELRPKRPQQAPLPSRFASCEMEVAYEGIRPTPTQVVSPALEEGAHVVGLSILSGSHLALIKDVMDRMRGAGLDYVSVAAGGIIPPKDDLLCGPLIAYAASMGRARPGPRAGAMQTN